MSDEGKSANDEKAGGSNKVRLIMDGFHNEKYLLNCFSLKQCHKMN